MWSHMLLSGTSYDLTLHSIFGPSKGINAEDIYQTNISVTHTTPFCYTLESSFFCFLFSCGSFLGCMEFIIAINRGPRNLSAVHHLYCTVAMDYTSPCTWWLIGLHLSTLVCLLFPMFQSHTITHLGAWFLSSVCMPQGRPYLSLSGCRLAA